MHAARLQAALDMYEFHNSKCCSGLLHVGKGAEKFTSGLKMSSATLPLAQHTSKSFWCASAAAAHTRQARHCRSLQMHLVSLPRSHAWQVS
jgi:hypothetical protein